MNWCEKGVFWLKMASNRAKTGQKSRFMFTDWLIGSFYKLFIYIDLLARGGQKRGPPQGEGVGSGGFSGVLGEETENLSLRRGRHFAGSRRSSRERFGRRFAWGLGFFLPVEIVRRWTVIICKILRRGRRLQQSVLMSCSSHSEAAWYWLHAENCSPRS